MVNNFIKICSNFKGEKSKILVLDSGIPTNNSLLKNIVFEKSVNFFDSPYFEKYDENIQYFYDNKRFSYEKEDEFDHYDHQTNIVSVITSNFLGISPKSKIICGKILNKHGKGPIITILEGLIYANKINPDIVNISTGYSLSEISRSQDYHIHDRINEEIVKLYEKNILVICSKKKSEVGFYPADFKETISVSENNNDNYNTSDYIYEKTNFLLQTNKNGLKIDKGSSFMTAFIAGVLSNYITFLKINKRNVNIEKIKRLIKKNKNYFSELYSPTITLAEMSVDDINNILKDLSKGKKKLNY